MKTSSENWKNRVEQSDASKFTVAGRLQKTQNNAPAKLQFVRTEDKKCQPLKVVRSANQPQLGLAKSPSMMVTSTTNTPANKNETANQLFLKRSVSINGGGGNTEKNNSSDSSDSEKNGKENDSGSKVVIPRIDDEETFEKFFSSKRKDTNDGEEAIEISDFDSVKASERLVTKRAVRGPMGRRAAKNPLKNLAARNDLQTEYTEIKSGYAEKELKRIKLESCKYFF